MEMTVQEFLENGKKVYAKLTKIYEWNRGDYSYTEDEGLVSYTPFNTSDLQYYYSDGRHGFATFYEEIAFEVPFEAAQNLLRENYDIEDIENSSLDRFVWILEETGYNFKTPSNKLKIGYKDTTFSAFMKNNIEKEHDFIKFQTEEEYYKPLKDAIDGYEVIECHFRNGIKMSWSTEDSIEVDFSNESLDDICFALEQEKSIKEIFGFLTLEDYLAYKEGGEYKGDFIGLRSEFFED